MTGPNRVHALRLLIAWAVLSLIGVVIAMQVHMPPGDQTIQGGEESSIIQLMLILATPVFIGVVMFLVYSAIVFRRPQGVLDDGPVMRGDLRLQIAWIGLTAVVVFILAGFGIVELANSSNATDFNTPAYQSLGQPGVKPVGTSESSELQVQVIAQQWYFTYRYPDYNVETTHLVLPVDANVEFHITSTDAIHSFWAYQLGVKADANPGVDNIAYAATMHTGNFTVRCAELCGLWHGNMFDTEGRVVSQGDFASWIKDQQASEADLKLPPYAPYYFPSPRVKGS
ncbi:MAG TPA: cytochrome c oxidase subunit II [Candidatus Udaeobacter sp.]|nr:cytochrome c oxidase subunit II [Candidatus Udaeobacter sp.]